MVVVVRFAVLLPVRASRVVVIVIVVVDSMARVRSNDTGNPKPTDGEKFSRRPMRFRGQNIFPAIPPYCQNTRDSSDSTGEWKR